MIDPRMTTLAKVLVGYSLDIKPGENVLLELYGEHYEFACELMRQIQASGGNPFLWLRDRYCQRVQLMQATPEFVELWAENDAELMDSMQCYIRVAGGNNANEMADVPADKMQLFNRVYFQKVHAQIRLPKTRWVVLRYPSGGVAQLAEMSTDAFEAHYFNVCCLDYAKMSGAMDALVNLMQRTDRVRLTARGTDIAFSIKGLPAIKCAGNMNIPDGEVFTAPVRGSVNGTITFNTPALYQGVTHENVSLTFKNGRIESFSGNYPALLQQIFDTDEGARYTGEFSFGVNPYITKPMKDTLFDEKIAGSIHFTPGNAYDECDNGNRSAIHWDLVLLQTPEYGGGDIFFDDVLIRHDGRFILPELECLNPENLK